jgi:hypothetical protein
MGVTTPGGLNIVMELGGAGDGYLRFGYPTDLFVGDARFTGTGENSITGRGFTASVYRAGHQTALVNIGGGDTNSIPLHATGSLVIEFNARVRSQASNAHLTVREVETGTVFTNLNQARLANFPASGVRFATGDIRSFNEVLVLPQVRIYEQSAGQFMTRARALNANNNILAIRLEAPVHYEWSTGLMGTGDRYVSRRGNFGPTVEESLFVESGRFLYVFVQLSSTGLPAHNLAGGLNINNLILVPNRYASLSGSVAMPTVRLGNAVRLETVNNEVIVHNNPTLGTDTTPPNVAFRDVPYPYAAWRASNLSIGNRTTDVVGLGHVTFTRYQANAAELRTGTPRRGSGDRIVNLRFEESVRGAWDSGIELSTLNIALPWNAEIVNPQFRLGDVGNRGRDRDWTYIRETGLRPGATFGTALDFAITDDFNMLRFVLPRYQNPGVGYRRTLEVRFAIEAAPGVGNINATVSGTAATRLSGSNAVLAAVGVDPVTVELVGPQGNVVRTDQLGLMHTATIGDILII